MYLSLFCFSGTEVRLHFTTVLCLILLIVGNCSLFPLVGIIMLSIIFHEFCHVLVARKHSRYTPFITIMPFGGIAQVPSDKCPYENLKISVAGPLGSFILFLILGFIKPTSYIVFAQTCNLALCVFNLIPAFPLDGGRIFLSTLQILKIRNSDSIVEWSGTILGILILVTAILNVNIPLTLIAIFILFSEKDYLGNGKTSYDNER